jgi:hypothetical protein
MRQLRYPYYKGCLLYTGLTCNTTMHDTRTGKTLGQNSVTRFLVNNIGCLQCTTQQQTATAHSYYYVLMYAVLLGNETFISVNSGTKTSNAYLLY